MKWQINALCLGTLGFLALAGGSALATPVITVEAGTGTDIVISSTNTGTTGATAATAWTIAETMNPTSTPGADPGHGHLQFAGTNGDPLGIDNTTGSGHAYGKWISKTVVNNTGVDWTSFELELQAVLGTPSGEGDGLSFADGSSLKGLFFSDVFSTYTRQDVTRDYLNFSGGTVAAGSSVTFNFIITDNRNNNPFYLLQTANKVDVVPEPATLALVAAAFVGAGLTRRRGR